MEQYGGRTHVGGDESSKVGLRSRVAVVHRICEYCNEHYSVKVSTLGAAQALVDQNLPPAVAEGGGANYLAERRARTLAEKASREAAKAADESPLVGPLCPKCGRLSSRFMAMVGPGVKAQMAGAADGVSGLTDANNTATAFTVGIAALGLIGGLAVLGAMASGEVIGGIVGGIFVSGGVVLLVRLSRGAKMKVAEARIRRDHLLTVITRMSEQQLHDILAAEVRGAGAVWSPGSVFGHTEWFDRHRATLGL